jgi:hypothetical protein
MKIILNVFNFEPELKIEESVEENVHRTVDHQQEMTERTQDSRPHRKGADKENFTC